MRNLELNKRIIYVLNYKSTENVVDGEGNLTGEKLVKYYPKEAIKAHVSGATGSSQVEVFGTDVDYDKTILLTKTEFKALKITENTVFFIDKNPVYDNGSPLYDYIVRRIAETINEVVIAVSKVRK